MTNFLISAFLYVTNDIFFWPSMAVTTAIGIFIGASIYNGDINTAKKTTISMFAYAILVIMTLSARIFPQLETITPEHYYMPFAGVMTVSIVTAFYLVGTNIGVRVTKHAHRQKGVRK